MKQIILDLTKADQTINIEEDSEIIGLFVGRDQDHILSTLNVIHDHPHLRSNTIIKAVVFDQSKFDLTGNLIIQKGASQTDAYLRIDVLVMSKDAFARAMPALEVMEDSVKGGHGATIGQVDQEQLFYLQSRGLNQEEAEAILVEGFVADLIEMVSDEKQKQEIQDMLKSGKQEE